MAGSRESGLKTADIVRDKYGSDYYKRIGSLGGSTPKKKPHGFLTMTPEQRRAAGKKGGAISRRTSRDT